MEKNEKKYKVLFDRANCIGAASCIAANPKRWQMAQDAKANLISAQKKENNDLQELIISETEFESMNEAAKACPVGVIKIVELKTDKKIA